MELIDKFIKIHHNTYDYSLVNHSNRRQKIKIICRKHGEFDQYIHHHLNGCGCRMCYIENKSSNISKFIKKAIIIHSDRYDYSKSKYLHSRSKLTISCGDHGEFEQTPNDHLRGHGCPVCGGTIRNSDLDIIDRCLLIHGNRYDYSKSKYISIHKKIIIICKEHGDFLQTPASHLNGKSGCPMCSKKFGMMENIWLDSCGVKSENRQIKISKYTVDGYDPMTNTIYEFNGDFWHGNPEKYRSGDINRVTGAKFGSLYDKTIKKENYLKSLGYNVISIWESDFSKKINFNI